ncbi:MAG: hypothetical protein H6735_30815 [Alphaproteobacteria bacterium]|nr:hypothetical protein [Alphaproteobacteria bacterium]
MQLSRLPASSGVDTRNLAGAPWMLPTVEQPWGNAAAQEQLSALNAPAQDQTARHVADCRAVRSLLAELLDSDDPIERNSAQYVDVGLVHVAALTATDDPGEGGRRTWFDPTSPYTSDAADPTRTVQLDPALVGETRGSAILLLSPSTRSRDQLAETLVHEVQHACDHHDETLKPPEVPGALDPCPDRYYGAYRSELAAEWLADPSTEGATDQLRITVLVDGSDLVRSVTTAMTDPRQLAIFRHFCGAIPADGVMKRDREWVTPYAWLPYYYACDPTFRSFVDTMVGPTTANGTNSLSIELLRRALVQDEDWREVVELVDDTDRAWLLDAGASTAFWNDLATHGVSETTQDLVRTALHLA